MLLASAGGGAASAQKASPPDGSQRGSSVDRAPYPSTPSAARPGRRRGRDDDQHGGSGGHLPPVRKNMELVGKLSPSSQGEIQPEQIADLAMYKGYAYLNSWSTEEC